MRIFRRLATLCMGALALSGCITGSQFHKLGAPVQLNSGDEAAQAPDWYVANRFRVIDGEEEELRFYQDLAAYLKASWAWSDKEKRAGVMPNIFITDLVERRRDDQGKLQKEQNYKTRYDNLRYRYEGGASERSGEKWALERDRVVRLDWPAAAPGDICQWTVRSSEGAPQSIEALCTAPIDALTPLCAPHEGAQTACVPVTLEQAYSAVAVNQRTKAVSASMDVFVKDTLIVAMGDSFSSGEGNPHMQWRILVTGRPETWWDSRCHRSLLSGPSLAAAFYAKANTKQSVTFMHYACSGASVADGIARPWRLTETSEKRAKWHGARLFKLRGYKDVIKDQQTPCVGAAKDRDQGIIYEKDGCKNSLADILPSQIAMAAHDLSAESPYPSDFDKRLPARRPDYLLLSVGGNDVGFSELVTAAAMPRGAAEDLRPSPKPDHREAASGDERRFSDISADAAKLIAQVVSAMTEAGADTIERLTFECLDLRIDCALQQDARALAASVLGAKPAKKNRQRLAAMAVNANLRIRTIISPQYEELHRRVQTELQPKKTIVTAYPSALTYYKSAAPSQVSFCNDGLIDSRPGLVPSPLNALPGLGITAEVSRLAHENVLLPLNAELRQAVKMLNEKDPSDDDWTFASEDFFALSLPFGYCSDDARMFNTLADASFFQGPAMQGHSPIGDLSLLIDTDKENGAPERRDLVWDVAEGCYKEVGAANQCTALPGAQAVRFHLKREDGDQEALNTGSSASKGTFHPTVLGHCMYALGIMNELDKSVGAIRSVASNRDDIEAAVFTLEEALTPIKELCAPEKLGFSAG